MLYLVDEMYKQKNKTINISIGDPISYYSLNKDLSDKEWAEEIKNLVYNLNKNNSIN